ncbi:putative O-methyltransferase domain, S-adenosyl-L-methionine-dependent methyltransferase [Helianthus anomalus]
MMRREKPICLSTSFILHGWGDEKCIKILKRYKEAIPSKDNVGKLIIIDMVVKVSKEENELLETQLLFDMLMMSLVTGRERSEKDWAKLFLDTSYTDYKTTPIFGFTFVSKFIP